MREDRWQHLVHTSLLLEEEDGAPQALEGLPAREERQRRAKLLLGSLLEVFPSSLDPVEDFEGYAVRRLAQALLRTLE
ncbi:hypothetical protein JY651_30885 [Pyxidicoccus parkwayensis]|uniref:Uncharacterized protein n=1 Tax=Pyxidicoccus parkwayensis TaxID=2813578 RepID=A0ABX7NMP3_9BACT|nr:hypothetical protein [Pyxidicoccus parkwaysis]QSQ19701.1 hypothetical protein JY651_30885 [Pyxidicoccus parkwaysis]